MSTIKLYSSINWNLLPGKLFKVEDIALYLNQFQPETITNFQYVKNMLEVSIKVIKDQSASQPTANPSVKYVSIKNDNENIAYYYVKRTSWRSKNCVQYDLVMDVLNTYNEGVDYNFRGNTTIKREHKSRWHKKVKDTYLNFEWQELIASSGTIVDGSTIEVFINDSYLCDGKVFDYGSNNMQLSFDGIVVDLDEVKLRLEMASITSHIKIVDQYNNYIEFVKRYEWQYTYTYVRNIDFINENINPLLIHSPRAVIQNPKFLLVQNWYLLYRNQNDDMQSLTNPVDCYLIPELTTPTNSAYIQNGRLIPSWLEEGKWYSFGVGSVRATLSNGVVTQEPGLGRIEQLLITKAGNKINVMEIWGTPSAERWGILWQYDDIEYIDFASVPVYYDVFSTAPNLDLSWASSYHTQYTFNNSGALSNLDKISLLDRVDPKNIKLIKIPYCPYNFTITNNVLDIATSDVWEYATIEQTNGGNIHALKLKDMSVKLSASFYNSNSCLYEIEKDFPNPPNFNNLRNPIQSIELESKMFHSEFYRPTYVYDSFSFAFEMEKLNIAYYEENIIRDVAIKFDMTSTINSKFMFTFTNYVCDKPNENYYNVLPIARNNDEVLYNVPYINYVRTGYNYDIKNKNLTNAGNLIGLGLSMASIGLSFVAPSASLKVAGIVASVISMANSVKSVTQSIIQNENSIRQKQEQLKNQTASVAGSDDVDLMSVYSDNRLSYIVYEPTEVIKNLLKDLFFYAGYNSNRMGIPTHNNRIYFDYLECDAQLDIINSNMSEDIINELVNSFKNGVTYIHKDYRYDLAQVYENWERELMED